MFKWLNNIFTTKNSRRKTPSILQMEAVECGAASLAMILAYYKKFVSLAELRIACGVSRDGSKASGIIQAAEKYGLIGKGYSKEVEELREMEAPYIVFWEFNHFLVVEGFKKNHVYLNDPAYGPRVVSLEEFENSFTGVVLDFYPSEEFKPSGEPPQLLPSLFRRIKGNMSSLVFLFLMTLTLFLPGLLLPILTKTFIDEVLWSNNLSLFYIILLGLLLTGVMNITLNITKMYFINKFQMFLSVKESSVLFWHILRLPIVFFSQRSSGDILSRSGVADSIAGMIAHDVIETFLSLLMVCLYTTVMFIFSPLLTVVSIVIALLNVVILKLSERSQINLNQSIANENGKWHGMAVNAIQMIETVKSSGLERDLFSSWIGQFTKLVNLKQELTKLSNILSSILHFLPNLNLVIILTIGGYLVIKGHMSLGALVAFQSLSMSLMHPFESLAEIMTKIQTMHGDMNRLDDVLLYPIDKNEQNELKNTEEAEEFKGHITFQNVSFGYNPNLEPIIQNFNLDLSPGKWVAIVGPSCSGRSSIARLAMGLYQPLSGQILYDNKPRSCFSPAQLATALSYVSQEIVLFEGTIRENLTMWNQEVPDEFIMNAAKDAQAHDIISARANGYESAIREGGANFSGGEKQRIEIARALSTNPISIVLDEATSALDTISELKVIQNIKKRNCSCLIISHRMSIIKECDEIIVLNNGKIEQQGTYEQLINEKNGLFLRLSSYE